MDTIVVCGTNSRIDNSAWLEKPFGDKKVFQVKPKHVKAAQQLSALKKREDKVILLKNSDEGYEIFTNGDKPGEVQHCITYAFSTLARGIDFPQFDIAAVSCNIFKPTCAYNAVSENQIEQDIYEERVNTVIQSAGRVLRGEKKDKAIVLDNLSCEAEFNAICSEMQKISKKPVISYYHQKWQSIDYYMQNSNAIIQTCSTDNVVVNFEDYCNMIKQLMKGSTVAEVKKTIGYYKRLKQTLTNEQYERIGKIFGVTNNVKFILVRSGFKLRRYFEKYHHPMDKITVKNLKEGKLGVEGLKYAGEKMTFREEYKVPKLLKLMKQKVAEIKRFRNT